MAPKFEVGSLGALVATSGLSALREAGKAADTGPALAIYYAQKWRNVSVQPDMNLTPAEMVAWVEQQAYDAWLKLEPDGKDAAFPFMVPGALLAAPTAPTAGARTNAVCRCLQASASPAARRMLRCAGTAKRRSGSMPKVCESPLLPPPRPLPRPTLLLCRRQKGRAGPQEDRGCIGGEEAEVAKPPQPTRRSQRAARIRRRGRPGHLPRKLRGQELHGLQPRCVVCVVRCALCAPWLTIAPRRSISWLFCQIR